MHPIQQVQEKCEPSYERKVTFLTDDKTRRRCLQEMLIRCHMKLCLMYIGTINDAGTSNDKGCYPYEDMIELNVNKEEREKDDTNLSFSAENVRRNGGNYEEDYNDN